jgi:hypothetical protein
MRGDLGVQQVVGQLGRGSCERVTGKEQSSVETDTITDFGVIIKRDYNAV